MVVHPAGWVVGKTGSTVLYVEGVGGELSTEEICCCQNVYGGTVQVFAHMRKYIRGEDNSKRCRPLRFGVGRGNEQTKEKTKQKITEKKNKRKTNTRGELECAEQKNKLKKK